MFKFTTIYYRVDDEETLEKFFSGTHRLLAEQLPGLVKIEVCRVSGQPGGQSRFHLSYGLYFATWESFERSLASEPGQKLMEALKPWADERLITWYYSDSYEEVFKRRGQPAKYDFQ